MSVASRAVARQTVLVPTIAAGWVLVVGSSLLLIIGRSPYTHGNLYGGTDPNYTRTAQITVGDPMPFGGLHGNPTGPGMSVTTSTSLGQSGASESLARGQKLMVTAGCATCHGLDGKGGPVGPSLVNASANKLRTRTDSGSGGMPAYAHGALSDDEIAALAAYLHTAATPTAVPATRG